MSGSVFHQVVQPEGWPAPRGYANAIVATGRLLSIGGQIGMTPAGEMQEGFVTQCQQALRNIEALLKAADALPEHVVRMTWYVTDIATYTAQLRPLGQVYRTVMGRHYPAMSLVQVVRLVEPAALVEIEATAVIP
ncbi:RidA family protein [Komagataeibacter xylinus]|nr:RidA family protein [Komagataeibacter xylinus]GBQ74083.1 endoribonuclease L-PSP [Komagataeibacter xylinus NBRC 15237]